MCLDGYGCFYSILTDTLWSMITAYKESEVTSCRKLQAAFFEAMEDIRKILEEDATAKL